MMKQVLAEYVPTRYKELGTREFTVNSFKMAAKNYFYLLCVYIVIHWAIGLKSPINAYIITQEFIVLSIIGLNLIARSYFKKGKAVKYMVLIAYLTGVWAPFVAGSALLTTFKKPWHFWALELGIALFGFVVSVMLHLLIVYVAIKNKNLKIRDRFTNLYIDLIGIIGILILYIAWETENGMLIYSGIIMVVIIFLYFSLFHLPRVLVYWREPTDKSNNGSQSIYGNALKMAKEGRKK